MANTNPLLSCHDEDNITILPDDLRINGTMTFKHSLMIKGILEGEIISEGLLVVVPTAKVTAKISTKNLISHGEIQGDVIATEQVILKETAIHTGNIKAPNIIVESGSLLNGSISMKGNDSAFI
jgi:cytoskeletal protein CcmA (bactofilin family)